MGMEHGKRCIRFAKALRLDFFPRLVQPATGERYASPLPSYQHFSAMGSDPIETVKNMLRFVVVYFCRIHHVTYQERQQVEQLFGLKKPLLPLYIEAQKEKVIDN